MNVTDKFQPDFWDGYVTDEPRHQEPIRRAVERLSPTLMAFAERALQEADVSQGSTVIDIGTQFGTVAVALARAGMRVFATDLSPEMVAHVDSYGIGAIQASVMNGEALSIPDAFFDAAFTMFGVTLFDDWRRGFAEMSRVLRPGATAVVGTWTSLGGAGAVRALYMICEELFPGTPPPELPSGVIEMQVRERFERAMTEAGFVDVRIAYEDQVGEIHPHDLDDPDRIFAYSSQWPLLDERQQRKVVEVMRERFSEKGTYMVTSTAGIAVGRRPLVKDQSSK